VRDGPCFNLRNGTRRPRNQTSRDVAARYEPSFRTRQISSGGHCLAHSVVT
jgi:hypothetical protein